MGTSDLLRAGPALPASSARCSTRGSPAKPIPKIGLAMAQVPRASEQSFRHTNCPSSRNRKSPWYPEIWIIAVRPPPTGRPARAGNLKTRNPAYPARKLPGPGPEWESQTANCVSNPVARVRALMQVPGQNVENAPQGHPLGSSVHRRQKYFVPRWALFIKPDN
jgi:hypothetical protein